MSVLYKRDNEYNRIEGIAQIPISDEQKEYVRKQYAITFETTSITLPSSAANAYEFQYDGYAMVRCNSTYLTDLYLIRGDVTISIMKNAPNAGRPIRSFCIAVLKGDKLYYSASYISSTVMYVAYYKERDYR